ncbi:MAG: SAF domain-containing protein [Cellulomonas sp.]
MRATRDRLRRLLTSVRRAVLRRRRVLAAALTAVAVAAGLHSVTAPPPPRIDVLVAARDLPGGTVLGPGDLTSAPFAPGSVPDDLATSTAGRTLAAPLRRGEPVTDVRLVGPGLADGHPGLTAVPVRLPDAGMVGLLAAGDRIDLVAADPEGSGARVVAGGVPVLAVPGAPTDAASDGVTGRLVVVGAADQSEVTRIADAAVRDFLTFTFAR